MSPTRPLAALRPAGFALSLALVLGAVAIDAAESDLWNDHSGPASITPGVPFTVTVGYGNLGPDTATSAYVNSYFTAPMGMDVFIDDYFNGGGAIFDAIQASAVGTDTLGNAPLLFWDNDFCEDLMFQLQRSDGDTDANPIEGLHPGVSASFSYDVVLPMASPRTGAIAITEPASIAHTWTASNPSNLMILRAAELESYGRGVCDWLVGGPDDDKCEYIDDNCFGARVSLIEPPIETDWEVVNDGSAAPVEGCSDLIGFTPGNVAVIRRGSCEFATKAFNAEQAGAVAAVIVNTDQCSDFPASDQCVINMGPGALGGLISIPVVMLAQADGEPVISTIQGGQTVHGVVGGASRFSAEGFVFLSETADDDPVEGNDSSTWKQAVSASLCTYALAPSSLAFGPGGGSGQVSVAAPGGCAWSASTTASWITFTSSPNGIGFGALDYDVAPTIGFGRSAVIELAGRQHIVTQQAGNGCTYQIDPAQVAFPGDGGVGSFTIAAYPLCEWAAVSTAPWLTLTTPASGAGSAVVEYTVDPGDALPRSGAILIADQVHSVDQQPHSGCGGTLAADDGTPENGYGWGVGRGFVQRFTPDHHPFVITKVCTAFTQAGGDPVLDFEVVVFDDDGPGGGPGTPLARVPASFAPVPPWLEHGFATVHLDPAGVTLDDGSVYLGVEWDDGAEIGFYVTADESAATPAQSGFFTADGISWTPIPAAFPGYRSLLVRGDGFATADGEWTQVVGHLVGGGNGFGDPANDRISAMSPFEGMLFAATANPYGAEVHVSGDGVTWSQSGTPGLGHPTNVEIDAVIPFSGHLVATTTNPTWGAEVWRFHTPQLEWTLAEDGGFGDLSNTAIPAAAVFDDMLYVGTHNALGCEIWRSADGTTWEQAHADGFGNLDNVTVSSMAVFRDHLYAGTANGDGAELWRTSDGLAWFAVATGGFGSAGNVAVSRLVVFDGALYAGVSNAVTGAQVWRSTDGTGWQPIVDDGFGDPALTRVDAFAVGDLGLHVSVSGPGRPGFLLRSADGVVWTPASSPGFTDEGNEALASLSYWHDRVFAGTSDPDAGCELWRGGWHPVFADGFESGDASAWSSVVP